MRWSAGGSAANRPDNVQAEGGKWEGDGQQVVLQQMDQITYILRVENGSEMVSSGSAANRPDHIQAEGRKWVRWSAADSAANGPDHIQAEGRK